MRCIKIPLGQTGHIHKLSSDYIAGNSNLRKLFAFEPTLAGMAAAIAERKKHPVNRRLLSETLLGQYSKTENSFFDQPGNAEVGDNIKALIDENTFTVTTGHQLNIFTGPLYYLYKLVSVIKYARQLSVAFPENRFVPVYWMATEDHDFEEINHFYLWGTKYLWAAAPLGAVGRMDPHSLGPLLEELGKLSMKGPHRDTLIQFFNRAYLGHDTLADAVRYMVHELFKTEGLVVIDGDDAELKNAMIPIFQKDIFENSFYKDVNGTIAGLEKDYKLPVSPREINVFYLGDKTRSRIVNHNGQYIAAEASKNWTADELQAELHSNPENFSPNVVLRPIYQEVILPNLCYIGGNSEIAYWLELKSAFDAAGIFYPQLLVRDSALFVGKKASKDLEQFKLAPEDLFLSKDNLMFKFYDVNMLEHAAEKDAEVLLEQYETLRTNLQGLPGDLVGNTIKQMNIHVKEVRRWKNEIHNKQLELQEKNVAKLEKLYTSFYPDGELQERHDNFIPYYIEKGADWIQLLLSEFSPLQAVCHIFIEE